jgi:hypothetical protein
MSTVFPDAVPVALALEVLLEQPAAASAATAAAATAGTSFRPFKLPRPLVSVPFLAIAAGRTARTGSPRTCDGGNSRIARIDPKSGVPADTKIVIEHKPGHIV